MIGRYPLYNGEITEHGPRVYRNGLPFDAKRSQLLYNHSPDGFTWGYQGSGPAQLALALLLDAVGDATLALKFYQDFKCDMVSHWPVNGCWHLTGIAILRWMSGKLSDASID